MAEPKKSDDGIVPIPDPSILTTQQLQREIFGLRELLEVKLGTSSETVELIRKIIETRLDGMDEAIKLLQDTADKFPCRIDEKITAVREVHEEKFASIQTQFSERDVRTRQGSEESKTAVNAALQAAKEAVGEQNKSSALAIAKSEAATTKQIDQMGTLIGQMTKAFDDKIVDVKDRVTRIEGTGAGVRDQRELTGATYGYAVGGVGVIIGLVGLVFAFLRIKAGG